MHSAATQNLVPICTASAPSIIAAANPLPSAIPPAAITGISTTTTILGHQQRGGSPTVRDRVAASLMAVKATELLQEGQKNKIIAEKNEQYIAIDIEEALSMKKHIDESMIETSKMLSL